MSLRGPEVGAKKTHETQHIQTVHRESITIPKHHLLSFAGKLTSKTDKSWLPSSEQFLVINYPRKPDLAVDLKSFTV